MSQNWPSRRKKRITLVLTDEEYRKWWSLMRAMEEKRERKVNWSDVASYLMEHYRRCLEKDRRQDNA